MRPCLLILILPVAALLIYAPTLTGDFVWDGQAQVLDGDYIHDPANLLEILTFRVLATGTLDANRPVQLLSLMIDASLWDKNPVGYRLTNLLLHLANALLLYLLATNILGARPPHREAPANAAPILLPALAASLVFILHPLAAEPVSSPGFREDLLATFFTLLALLGATRFEGRHWFFASAALLCTLLAIASKENALAAPIALAAFYLLFRRHQPRQPWLRFIGLSFLIVIAFLAARFLLQTPSTSHDIGEPVRIAATFLGGLALQLRFWALDLRNLLWPANLSAVYGPQSIQGIPTALAAVILAVAALLTALWARRDPRILLGAALALAAILPVSNIVPIYFPLADRYLYLPLVGLSLGIAIATQGLLRRFPGKQNVIILLCLIPLTALGIAGAKRAAVWKHSRSLWEDTILKNPHNAEAHLTAGLLRYRDDDPAGAVTLWKQAVVLSRGQSIEAYTLLALGLETLGQKTEAEAALISALQQDPTRTDPNHPAYRTWTTKNKTKLKAILTRLKNP